MAEAVNVLYTGYFGRGNLGDDAMRDGTLLGLQALSADHVYHPMAFPAVRFTSLSSMIAYLRAVKANDAVVINGGTHFHEEFGIRSARIILSFIFLLGSIRLLRKKCLMVGVATGVLTRPWSRFLLGIAFRLPTLVVARDEISASVISELSGRQCSTAPDMAFLLPIPPAEQPGILFGVAPVPYFDYYRGDPAADTAEFESIAEAIVEVADPDDRVRVFVFSTATPGGDLDSASILAETFECRGITAEVVHPTSPEEALKLLGECATVIAWRYHAQLLAALAGRPLAIVAYEPKCDRLRQQLGLSSSCSLRPEEITLTSARRLLAKAQAPSGASLRRLRTEAELGLRPVLAELDGPVSRLLPQQVVRSGVVRSST